jgi:hypothetical protein
LIILIVTFVATFIILLNEKCNEFKSQLPSIVSRSQSSSSSLSSNL